MKSSLIQNGVVHAQANAYGIHKATKPLYEGAFANVSETVKTTAEKAMDLVQDSADDQVMEDDDVVSGDRSPVQQVMTEDQVEPDPDDMAPVADDSFHETDQDPVNCVDEDTGIPDKA